MNLNFQIALKFPELDKSLIIPDYFSVQKKQSLSLTPREMQCLLLASKGCTEKETARDLQLSYGAIEADLENIKAKIIIIRCSTLIITQKIMHIY